jgi:ATP diphosphatase
MSAVDRLRQIMVRLRDPAGGCPWDREQDWASIAPHTIEEAYELADAIARGEPEAVRDELGDVLFQVVFQSRIAEERGLFDFDAVAASIADKLERRHPHVFADATIADSTAQSWPGTQRAERVARGRARSWWRLAAGADSRDQARFACREGRFRLDQRGGVIAKVREELGELQVEIDRVIEPGRTKNW